METKLIWDAQNPLVQPERRLKKLFQSNAVSTNVEWALQVQKFDLQIMR